MQSSSSVQSFAAAVTDRRLIGTESENWILIMRWEQKWRQQKGWENTADQVLTNTSCCAAEFSLPCSEWALSISPASCSLIVGWNPDATRAGAPHPARPCVHGPPAGPVKPTVYSLPAGLGANAGRRRGGRFVQHYQDNGAIWGTEGTQARLFTAQQTPRHIMCGGGHLRVTVFCITSDEKGKVISSPFNAIIGRT